MKRILLNLFLWSAGYAQAMPKDTLYHVRFVSAADSSSLYSAQPKAMSSGITIASWEADTDGYIRIKKKDISKPHVVITLQYPGFESKTFKADTLSVNDTIVIAVKPKMAGLDEIRIIAYKVPMIGEKQKSWGRRQKQVEEEPEVSPVYSPGYCLAYEALQKGLWLNKDSTSRRSILAWDTLRSTYKGEGNPGLYLMVQLYFMNNMAYPKQARDLLMEETVYMCFEFDEKGDVNYLQVMKGKHVDLVLEVANALARMPRINLRDAFPDYESYPPKRLKPVRMLLPVKFILQ